MMVRRFELKSGVRAFVMGAVCLCAAGAVRAETITWNATTGDWSEPTNWNPQQVPTTADEVVFPDLGADYTITVDSAYTVKHLEFSQFSKLHTMTLTGTGSLTATTASKSSEGKINARHKLVLDGVSVYMPKDYIMLYAPLEAKNGATFSIGTQQIYVNHNSSCPLTVTDGHVICGNITHNNETLGGFVHLNGGSITATSFSNYKTGTKPFDITITDGVFEIKKLNVTSSHETLRMTGGTLRITEGYNLNGGTIDLTGGTLELAGEFYAIDTLTTIRKFVNGTTVDTSKAVLAATNGTVQAYAGALTVGGLKNSGNVAGTFEIDDLTFAGGATAPFTFTGQYYKNFYLYGPTILRAQADMNPLAASVNIYLHGAFTVDTAESRTFVLDGAISDEGSADLTVTGGGTLKMVTHGRTESYASVQVAEGTTLDLIPPTNGGTVIGHLKTEKFALGANATLKLVAGDTFIEASDWEIDSTAKIIVTVPSTFTEGACAILQDMNSLDFPAEWLERIEVSGAPDGMTLKSDHGQITLFKRPNDLGKWGEWEWTGAGANAKWSTVANWFGAHSNMPEKVTAYFGSSSKTNSNFDAKLWNGSKDSGSTVGALVFQTNAVDTFTISGTQMTISDVKPRSYSSVPQVIGFQPRASGGVLYVHARGDAPIVLTCGSPAASKQFSVSGDVRLQKNNVTIPFLHYDTAAERSGGTWFSILNGVTCNVKNQTDALYGSSCGIRVAAGGTLVFSNGTSSARLRIDRAEHSFVVNGLMDVQAPFYGRNDNQGGRHVFRGTGRLNLSSVVPFAYSMRAIFADTLNVYLTNDWTTASSAASGFGLTARGNPILHVGDGWTYGPSGETTVAQSQRQLEIEKAGVLRVDAAGGAVTFGDPFVGPGTLAITNATLALAGAFETDAKVRIDAEATLTIAANQTIGGLSGLGGALRVEDDAVLTVAGDVDLTQVELPQVKFGWRRILNATGTITTPADPLFKFRTVEQEGVKTLSAKRVGGMSLFVR